MLTCTKNGRILCTQQGFTKHLSHLFPLVVCFGQVDKINNGLGSEELILVEDINVTCTPLSKPVWMYGSVAASQLTGIRLSVYFEWCIARTIVQVYSACGWI